MNPPDWLTPEEEKLLSAIIETTIDFEKHVYNEENTYADAESQKSRLLETFQAAHDGIWKA